MPLFVILKKEEVILINPIRDKLLANQKPLLYAAAAALLLIADFYFIIKPVIGGLSKIIPDVNAKASRLNIIKIDVKNIPVYENQINNLRVNLSKHKSRFSTKDEISPLLKNLSDTAKACDVKIVTINPLEDIGQSQKKQPVIYREFPIILSAVSGYHSFGLFLSKLENSDTFMRVIDLKIAGDSSGEGNHKFDVTIVTYMLAATEEEK